MCGRFALSLSRPELEKEIENLNLNLSGWIEGQDNEYRPSYNIAPQNKSAVIRQSENDPAQNHLECMPTYKNMLNTINARDDKVLESKGLWNSIKAKKRCIVVSQGFFEWQTKGKEKIPHFTKLKDDSHKLMCFAGLWDSVKYQDSDEIIHTFTIITTSSNSYLSFLHDRMPVILKDQNDMKTWLDTSSSEWTSHLSNLLKPFDQDDGLMCYKVPKEVGKVGNQSPDFLKPVNERKGAITSFFNQKKLNSNQTISKSTTEKNEKDNPSLKVEDNGQQIEGNSLKRDHEKVNNQDDDDDCKNDEKIKKKKG